MIYTARVLPDTRGDIHRFLADYLDQQRRLLATTTPDYAGALALIPHPGLRQRLHQVYAEALSL